MHAGGGGEMPYARVDEGRNRRYLLIMGVDSFAQVANVMNIEDIIAFVL